MSLLLVIVRVVLRFGTSRASNIIGIDRNQQSIFTIFALINSKLYQ